MRLKGKSAIVTGGGRDIGRACAIALARAGASVAISYLNSAAAAAEVVADIREAGGRTFALQGDMTRPDDAALLVEKTASEFGAVDILLHNVGGMVVRRTLREMALADWQSTMDLNVTSLFLVVKAALPHMGKGGAILTMASDAGRDGGGPRGVAYATSKGAVMTMTRALAKELAPDIRVNALCPGSIGTTLLERFTAPERRRAIVDATPLRREGTPEDVAHVAVFLASDHAAFMTGACVDINGGTVFS